MDFFRISEKKTKKDGYTLKPDFLVKRSEDLMIRGKSFYAIWDEDSGFWSTNEYRVGELVDAELYSRANELSAETEQNITVASMLGYSSNSWKDWRGYLSNSPDNYHSLDQNIKFMDDKITREDYATFALPYCLSDTPIPNYEALMSVLYEPEEREKLEWAIGSIVAGESKNIQKFFVLYGSAGSGKSTFLNILDMLFQGYTKKFEAQELGQRGNQFSMEAFRTNPLVAIQHDGDLSRLEDNTRINSIVSHEEMLINEKHKSNYQIKLSAMLFMGTNQPVRITDAKSGIIRRLIDVHPSGEILPHAAYRRAVKGIPFELGGIAQHCLNVFNELGPDYYDKYTPLQMMYQTDLFFNFVEEYYYDFKENNYVTLNRAWELYKKYCEDTAVPYRLSMIKVKEELKNYFENFYETKRINGEQKRKVYMDFKYKIFTESGKKSNNVHTLDDIVDDEEDDDESEMITVDMLSLDSTQSELDILLKDCPAQYASTDTETPLAKWEKVTTKLGDLDTTKLHYVLPPENLIVIDFDLKDKDGNKDATLNLEAAATWPLTYAEFSKGGAGVHLHYIYDGDVSQLSALYSPGIEVKVFRGKASLRRRLGYCNDIPVAHLSSGLPLKEEKKKMVNFNRVMSEKGLRNLINRNLRKEIVPATKPSIDFIYNDLEAAYKSGLIYDVRDMRGKILAFANNSTHQRDYCVRLVAKMKFCSEEEADPEVEEKDDEPLIAYDCECFPNVFIVCWKKFGEGQQVVRMINPSPNQIESLLQRKLISFNGRKYDGHMLTACLLGENNYQLYQRSRKLTSKDKSAQKNGFLREGFNVDYADIYEFSSKKQSLKKWEIELGLHHQENEYPWEEPLPEEHWEEVTDYCCNDVVSTEAVFNHCYPDYLAFEMMSELTGMPINSNGNSMAAKLIFGNDKSPHLVYTDLATGKASDPEYQRTDIITAFPGYEFKKDPKTGRMINWFRGTDVGMGGYVYSEPGIYTNVALLDVASLHPHSIIAMNYFGPYTKTFEDLVETRVHIKHKDLETAKTLFNGRLAQYLEDPDKIGNLAYSLKIFINKVYGMTSAKFDNIFKDPRNVNNIVALRGALFMRTLQDEVASRGFTVAHIKTDSIKIPNATPEIIQFCMEFAKQYGYTFEHEATYDRMCLVNDSTYIAKYATAEKCQRLYGYTPGDNVKEGGKWTATAAQFQIPFVFKTLFSKEPIEFSDLCETKQVTSKLYLDFNEKLSNVELYEDELKERIKSNDPDAKVKLNPRLSNFTDDELRQEIEKGHEYKFVGRIGLFTPVVDGVGGGRLVVERNGKFDSANGAKGYRWLESETVKSAGLEDKVDLRYYRSLVDDAKDAISKYGDFEWFVNSDDPPSEANHPLADDDVPWLMPCKDPNKTVCEDCPEFETCPYLKHGCEDKDPFKRECVDCPDKDQCQQQMQTVLDEAGAEQFNRR